MKDLNKSCLYKQIKGNLNLRNILTTTYYWEILFRNIKCL